MFQYLDECAIESAKVVLLFAARSTGGVAAMHDSV